MLGTIPFHSTLLRRELKNGTKSTTTHVLLYGAIEVHSLGEKGCIAGNTKLAKEIGISPSRLQSALSEIAAAGWVVVHLDEKHHRKSIEPLAEIKFDPLPHVATPLATSGNIDNSLDNNTTYSASDDATSSKPNSFDGALDPPNSAAPPTTLKLLWDVVKKYNLPVLNANHIRKWANDLEQMDDGAIYLQKLLSTDLRQTEGDFKPTLNSAYDVIAKKLKIQRFFNNGQEPSAYDPRVYGIKTA